jgi:hypothetical protein
MTTEEINPLIERIAKLFRYFPPGSGISILLPTEERELLQKELEHWPFEAAVAAIDRYAMESTVFDRVRLQYFLGDEFARRNPRISETPSWANNRNEDRIKVDRALAGLSKEQVNALIQRAREHYADAFAFMRSDPLLTDLGKALIYSELKKSDTVIRLMPVPNG